jgi:hypothetical protein
MSYAAQTEVSVDKTQVEIQQMLRKYGAKSFAFGEESGKGIVMFEAGGKRVRFVLPLPDPNAREYTHTESRGWRRNPEEARKAWEQGCRSRWRALLLNIKAKMEAVAIGITTFEEEFLAHIVINGRNVGDVLIPQIEEMTRTGNHGPLLLGPASNQ